METNAAPRVAAVLLAAGESTRMEEMKALLPWIGGKPLLAYQTRALSAAGYAPIIVVLGHLAERLRQTLTGPEPAIIVENPRYREGRTTSIVAGLRETPDDAAAALIVSVDQPRSDAMLASLRTAWLASRPSIAVPSIDGQAGHPPLFSASLLPELLAVTEERQGLREVVARHRAERLLVPTDYPLALTNLNTREEYEAALRLAGARR